MNIKFMHPADQIVTLMDRIYTYGMTTVSGGNLSIKDPDGNIWISPSGIDKGSLTRDDIMCVKPDGTVIGKHRPSVELPFHQMLYKKRPDINAVMHAHPPALVALSLISKNPDTALYPQAYNVCGKILMSDYEIPGSDILARNITDMVDDTTNAVMMENHGAVVISKCLFECFKILETLEYCARCEINANRLGSCKPMSEEDKKLISSEFTALDTFEYKAASSEECALRGKMSYFAKRSYNMKLFTSTQGTIAHRLGDDDFLITPHGCDRKYLEAEDVVRVKGGKCESGKIPSYFTELIRKIFMKHSDINAVMFSNPPAITAFAVGDTEFDSRTIPESYLNLRHVPKIAIKKIFDSPDYIADNLTLNRPVALFENMGVITVGATLINAFDRLEVSEYSAKSIIDASLLGSIHLINDKQVKDIDVAFNLGYDD